LAGCLEFLGLCNRFIPDACKIEDFSALYMIRRTKEGGYFFNVRSGSKRLIINLATSIMGDMYCRPDHGAWEMVTQMDRGTVPTSWSKGTFMHREIQVTREVKEMVQSLPQIEIDHHNWS